LAIFDGGFYEHSFGFRLGRSAHDAVKASQGFISEGCTTAIDIDLAKYFDTVNEKLMAFVAREVEA
jgi:retron-type reverse transcriptase